MAKFILSAFADEADDSPAGQIAALRRNGLHCIEPRGMNGPLIEKTEAEVADLRRQLDDAGITVPSFGSPIGKYSIDEDFEPHLALFRHALRICSILGAGLMRIFSFFVPQERLRECRPEVMRRLSVFLEEAEKAGVVLCHENESGIYGQNPEQVEDLLASLPTLHGIFDAANFIKHDQDPLRGFEATCHRLSYIHVKDALPHDKAMVPVGEGGGCYREILSKTDRMYDGEILLTVEPHLHIFQSYRHIDPAKLKLLRTFSSGDEAFDCAVSALKKMLADLGHPVIDGRA